MNVLAATRDPFEDILQSVRWETPARIKLRCSGTNSQGVTSAKMVIFSPRPSWMLLILQPGRSNSSPKVVFCPIYESQDVHTKEGSAKDSGIKGHPITHTVIVGTILSPSKSTGTSSRTADVSLDCNELEAS
jgi:hypothetical protein